ncbi:DUF6502 family protein [Marinimicrobium alkaliphilum]|uniref:DUF6502 family protein n=1 Tax=Marinimicrobium alkaliphilum TaxID=2202654 RepID=UPI000DBA45AE|nr:DUF6502 family protein [Marinimicrobium alkaliphilum]
MNEKTQQALVRALYKLLRPMVRLLLRHGVSYRLFADIARRAYIDVAQEEFTLPGRKQTHSRVAVLTGINRKDIARIQEQPHPLEGDVSARPAPASRIIDAWLNDRRYISTQGHPKPLMIEGGEDSFTQLVRDHGSDVPVRAMLDELVRIGVAERQGDKIKLATEGYIPFADTHEKIRIMGTAASDLINTLDHNLGETESEPFIQRTVAYDDIPLELLDEIRQRSRAEGEAFILQVNQWLYKADRTTNDTVQGSGKARAGIGIYYFEYPRTDDGERESS